MPLRASRRSRIMPLNELTRNPISSSLVACTETSRLPRATSAVPSASARIGPVTPLASRKPIHSASIKTTLNASRSSSR